MCRKQPIPTNLDQVFGENYLAQDIYIYCLLRARNDENPYEKEYAWTLHTLQKWQWVFGDEELAKRFRCDRKTIRKTLEKLQNVYNKMDIKRTTKGTVYSIVWYDDVVSMDNKMDNKGTTKGQQKDNSVDTNKNDKNEESDKNKNILLFGWEKISVSSAFDLFWKEYPKKEWKEKARTRFEEALKRKWVTFDLIMKWLQSYKKQLIKNKTERKYTKNAEWRLNWWHYVNDYWEQTKTDDALVEELAQDRTLWETDKWYCMGANFKIKYGAEVYNRIRTIFTTTQADRANELKRQGTIQRMQSI